jgi:NHL repeat/Beta-propeller repeat
VVLAVEGGNTTIVAGSYEGYGETGDGGLAVDATLYQPVGLAYDPTTDELFIADSGDNVVREVNTSTGIIGRFAGDGTAGDTGNGGAAVAAELDQPQGLAVDANGDVFITDADNNEVREVTPNGDIQDFAGDGTAGYTGDGGPATAAELTQPSGVAVDIDGNVYIADSANDIIRRVDATTHDITTVGGTTTPGYTGDNGPATAADLDDPQAIAVDPDGDVFVADTFNNTVRKITPADQISTVISSGLLNAPYALTVDDSTGNIYVTNTADSYILESSGLGSINSPAAGPVGSDLTPQLAESPLTVLLPLIAALLLGGGFIITRRRSLRRAA